MKILLLVCAVFSAIGLADCPTGEPRDVMVPVGAWCVDKYPATICTTARRGAAFASGCISNSNHNNGPSGGGYTHELDDPKGNLLPAKIAADGRLVDPTYRAYSTPDLIPTRFVNYYQALAACLNAGKALIPDSVFVAAALGTFMPPEEEHDGMKDTLCNTALDEGNRPGSLRAAGHAGKTPGGSDSCISNWGVEDMIGMWEWTDLPTRIIIPENPPVPSTAQGSPWFAVRGRGSVLTDPPRRIDARNKAHIHGFRCARPRF